MSKNVQIPQELFIALCRVYLLGDDDRSLNNGIRRALEAKLEALQRHEQFTTYKTADTPEERQKARRRYLDSVGIPEDFRWGDETDEAIRRGERPF